MPEVPQVATRSPQGATRSPQGKRRSGIFSSPTPLGSPQAATPPGAGRAPESGRPPEPFLAYVPTVIAPKGAAPPVRRTPQQAPAKASPVPAATSARRAGTAPPDARTAVLQVDPPAVPDVIREERSASPPAAAFGASPDAVRTIIGRDAGPLPPAAAVPDATESERPASASGNIELSLPAYLMNLSSVSFDTDGSPEPWQPVKSVTQRRTVTYVRSMAAGRPWILPVLFVLTVSIALGVTVAIVRVLAW